MSRNGFNKHVTACAFDLSLLRTFGSERDVAIGLLAMGMEGSHPADGDLTGLAELWEGCKPLTRAVIKGKSLLEWPNAKATGRVNYDSLLLNYRLMDILVEFWCPRSKVAQTVYLPQIKYQVGECYVRK